MDQGQDGEITGQMDPHLPQEAHALCRVWQSGFLCHSYRTPLASHHKSSSSILDALLSYVACQ
jgi:hypothetical protein